MSQQAMRITIDAAMRARDVSRPRAEGEEAAPAKVPAEVPKARPMSKGERRRLGKRGARQGRGGSSPDRS